jgi:two-component system KDP operon response regulator KdpE
VAALRAGADDYIVKGVGAAELLARIRVNLDRADMPAMGEESDRLYEDDNLKINYTTQSVWVRGDLVDLTPTEYRLLSFLVANPDTPLSSDFLVRRLWEPGYTSDLVKFHIRYLRQKIELDYKKPSLIMTRVGFGYFYAP